MDDQTIEQEIQAKGLTAPRITPADIEANIANVEIVKHVSKAGQVLRWAVLTTLNGFAVTGKPSAAVSSENDNEEIGTQVAIENAKAEMWQLMGYELKSRLAAPATKKYQLSDVASYELRDFGETIHVRFTDGKQGAVAMEGALPDGLVRAINKINQQAEEAAK